MEVGFIPDTAYGAVLVGSWVEGTPEKRFFGTTLALKGKKRLEITCYRCASCGYLESYADADA
jgi:hypothetical protein